MGPTTKLPSLGHISFVEMRAAYAEQMAALIDAGVDILLVETCQDLLQAKIAHHRAASTPCGKKGSGFPCRCR